MAVFKAHKVVSALPDPLEADTIYFVRVGTGFDVYVTDTTGAVAYKQNASEDMTPAEILTAIKTVDGTASGLDADLLDGVQGALYQRQIDEYIVDITSPDASAGEWVNGGTDSWGTPRIGAYAARFNDAPGYLQFNIPAGMDTAYISQLTWPTGGYVDVYGVQSDGGLVFLRRINTRQQVENSNEGPGGGNGGQHDGSTITLAATGLSTYSAIRLFNRLGRVHLTGMSFTSAKLQGTEGTGMVHPAQLSQEGSGSGLDADLLDGEHGSYYYSPTNAPDPTLTITGDASGNATFTNLGNATLTLTIADDSHNHVISNVDGLQSALDGKLSASGKAADSDLLDGIDSGSFLRSDVSDTMTGTLSIALGPQAKRDAARIHVLGGISNGNYDAITWWQGNSITEFQTQLGSLRCVYTNNGRGELEWWGRAQIEAEEATPGSGSPYFRVDNLGRVTMPFQPAFRAGFPQPNGWVTVNPNNKHQFSSAPLNVGNHYDTANSRFTAPVNGVYQFSACLWIASNIAADFAPKVNGAYVTAGTGDVIIFAQEAKPGYANLAGTFTLYLNVNDQVELFARNFTTTYYSGHSWWEGHLLG